MKITVILFALHIHTFPKDIDIVSHNALITIACESSSYFKCLDDGMVDMRDLKSLEHYVRVGSTPIRGTNY